MPRKSIVELEAQAAADLPDNTAGAISPADVRNLFLDLLNAIRPAYGSLKLTANNVVSLGLTPVAFTYTSAQDSNINYTNSSAATGRITRLERGTCTINFTMDFECTAGRYITFALYKDGADTGWSTTANGGGAGNPVSASFTAIDYADPAAYYEVRASAELAATSTTLRSGGMVLQIEPVNSFT